MNILEQIDKILLIILIKTMAVYIKKIILYKIFGFKIK